MKEAIMPNGDRIFIIDDVAQLNLNTLYLMGQSIQVVCETVFGVVNIPEGLKVICNGLRIYEDLILTKGNCLNFISFESSSLYITSLIGKIYFSRFEIIPPKGIWTKKTLQLFRSFFNGGD